MRYKCIVTTSWDDGHKLDLKLANLLLQYKLRGTFFIPINYSDNCLSKKDIVFLSKHFEIGAHSLTHPQLTKIPLDDARREIAESKKLLEGIIGRTVHGFSYPSGDFDNHIVECVKRSGYAYARTNELSMTITDPHQMTVTTIFRPYSGITQYLRSVVKVRNFAFKGFVGATFEQIYSKGGVWHMLGHSWQIEKLDMWDELEAMLSFISNRRDILYATNHEVIKILASHPCPSVP